MADFKCDIYVMENGGASLQSRKLYQIKELRFIKEIDMKKTKIVSLDKL